MKEGLNWEAVKKLGFLLEGVDLDFGFRIEHLFLSEHRLTLALVNNERLTVLRSLEDRTVAEVDAMLIHLAALGEIPAPASREGISPRTYEAAKKLGLAEKEGFYLCPVLMVYESLESPTIMDSFLRMMGGFIGT